MIDHFIWDFDGSLFDSYPVMAKTFQTMLGEIGIEESLEAIMGHLKVSMSHALLFYKKAYDLSEAFIKAYEIRRIPIEIQNCQPYPEALALCLQISRSGKKNYLYTHRDTSAIVLLEKFGLKDHFTDYITVEDNFERKPSPEALLHLLKTNGIEPEKALMIGDRSLDILAAKNAGIKGCFFSETGVICEEADYNIISFNELSNLV